MIRKSIGTLMVASPFIGLGAIVWASAGPLAVAGLFGSVGALCGIIFGGLYLLEDH